MEKKVLHLNEDLAGWSATVVHGLHLVYYGDWGNVFPAMMTVAPKHRILTLMRQDLEPVHDRLDHKPHADVEVMSALYNAELGMCVLMATIDSYVNGMDSGTKVFDLIPVLTREQAAKLKSEDVEWRNQESYVPNIKRGDATVQRPYFGRPIRK